MPAAVSAAPAIVARATLATVSAADVGGCACGLRLSTAIVAVMGGKRRCGYQQKRAARHGRQSMSKFHFICFLSLTGLQVSIFWFGSTVAWRG
jgi:hypothetical protein